MIKFEYNNTNGPNTDLKNVCYDLHFFQITINDPLLTITYNVKYESTRYKGKIIGYTRMIFNKIWYKPSRFSNFIVLPLGDEIIRVKYEPDRVNEEDCMAEQRFYT